MSDMRVKGLAGHAVLIVFLVLGALALWGLFEALGWAVKVAG